MSEDAPLVPLEVKVRDQARLFSLPALLDILHFLNYRSDDIEFRSHLSQARPASLIHAVEFLGAGRASGERRKVKVTLNLGLLSVQSPLPSYLLKFAESLEGEALIDFLGFFDHHLLKRRTMGLYPERDRTVFADWAQAQSELLQMTGLSAPSTLFWLCERVFPELGVRVERSTAQRPLRAKGAVLGHAVLGEGCAFGAETSVPVGGIDITLYAEETQSPTGVPWPKEVAERLHKRLFPIIGGSELYLRIYLVMLEQENWLQVQNDRFLGFEPLWDPSQPKPAAPAPKALRELQKGQPEKVLRRSVGAAPPPPPAKGAAGKVSIPPSPPPTVPTAPDEREAQRDAQKKRRIYQVQLLPGRSSSPKEQDRQKVRTLALPALAIRPTFRKFQRICKRCKSMNISWYRTLEPTCKSAVTATKLTS